MGRILRVLCPVNVQLGDLVLWLIGARTLPFTIVSVIRCGHYVSDSSNPDYEKEAENLHVVIPEGLEVVGAICMKQPDAVAEIRKVGEIASKMQNTYNRSQSSSDGVIVACVAISANSVEYSLYVTGASPKFEVLESVKDAEAFGTLVWSNLVLVRCQMQLTLPLHLVDPPSHSDYKQKVSEAVENVKSDLQSSRVVFLAKGTTVISQKQGFIVIQPFNQLRCSQPREGSKGDPVKRDTPHTSLCSDLSSPASFISIAGGTQIPKPLELMVMFQKSCPSDGNAVAPVIQYVPAINATVVQTLKLSMDVVCMVTSHMQLVEVAKDLVLPSLLNQLVAMHQFVVENAACNAKVGGYHFCPPGWQHPVTAIYDLSYGEAEHLQVEQRRNLHQRLGLPADRPLLRVANAISFENGEANVAHSSSGRRLMDVHIGIVASGVNGGHQSLIKGSYEYYHYMQDRFDDNVWTGLLPGSFEDSISGMGLCISLATNHCVLVQAAALHTASSPLSSRFMEKSSEVEFVHSSSTGKELFSLITVDYLVPLAGSDLLRGETCLSGLSFLRRSGLESLDIQEILVEIGDKEPSFIGSEEWIGAIELSFVLDKLLGISCKVVNLRSGADMPSKCRELALHFQTQGTPVMIGGGVLAYTLLGVDYNEFTGDSAFLILDPHYTGGEDRKAIRSGGWCGWKKPVTVSGQEFFLRNRFYNLLLPQRPSWV